MPALICSAMSAQEVTVAVCKAMGSWQQSAASRHSPPQDLPVGSMPKSALSHTPLPVVADGTHTKSLAQSPLTRQLSPRAPSWMPRPPVAPPSPVSLTVQRLLKHPSGSAQSRREAQLSPSPPRSRGSGGGATELSPALPPAAGGAVL